jgi:glycopeptide antibiotics resistance protein
MKRLDCRLLGRLAVGLVLIWLGYLTLSPDDSLNHTNLAPFAEKREALACILADCWHASESAKFLVVDVLGNVAVFLPLGAALALSTHRNSSPRWGWRRWLGITAAGLLVSLVAEAAQLLIPSRATDIDDLIFNTLGTALGAGIVMIGEPLWRWAVPRDRPSSDGSSHSSKGVDHD